jgi:LysM repeat protein/Tfp pilus assembly protein PilF
MKWRFPRWFAGAALSVALCGCMPSSQGPADEQKEPYFLTGKARVGTLDFKGAMEAFEKAIEANPQNASAHFELGLLCEKETDYAAAIYHFERYLKLRPDSAMAGPVKERISTDKMELSKTTAYAPMTQTMQREFDNLLEESKKLRADNEKLRAALASQSGRGSVPDNLAGQSGNAGSRPPSDNPGPLVRQGVPPAPDTDARPSTRTYAVKAGDTLTSIARKYGVKVDALLAANPTLDPKRMKVGQALKIPLP